MSEPEDADDLTALQRSILDFEGSARTHAGAKASAIRARFGWSTTRYYQLLNALIDTEAALRYDAMLVRRLQRIRDRGEAS
ncbi:DUF3263 domain-containing protein [Agrococcus jejuensis]|uniref:DUF3263 domain-containing protein n=1 Tax=Agrococcus jejuensis TaxID=399736 RepID=A0A1G8BA04_9MICO|nr:DUF3263 domain-containing protein [Agrococcus jejuensis]SDH30069.1 Protein of unknown function [Agrococcus jejuensis]